MHQGTLRPAGSGFASTCTARGSALQRPGMPWLHSLPLQPLRGQQPPAPRVARQVRSQVVRAPDAPAAWRQVPLTSGGAATAQQAQPQSPSAAPAESARHAELTARMAAMLAESRAANRVTSSSAAGTARQLDGSTEQPPEPPAIMPDWEHASPAAPETGAEPSSADIDSRPFSAPYLLQQDSGAESDSSRKRKTRIRATDDPVEMQRRERISRANSGKVPWNLGKKHSDATRQKISQRTREAMQTPQVRAKLKTWAGRAHTEESKRKISEGIKAALQMRGWVKAYDEEGMLRYARALADAMDGNAGEMGAELAAAQALQRYNAALRRRERAREKRTSPEHLAMLAERAAAREAVRAAARAEKEAAREAKPRQRSTAAQRRAAAEEETARRAGLLAAREEKLLEARQAVIKLEGARDALQEQMRLRQHDPEGAAAAAKACERATLLLAQAKAEVKKLEDNVAVFKRYVADSANSVRGPGRPRSSASFATSEWGWQADSSGSEAAPEDIASRAGVPAADSTGDDASSRVSSGSSAALNGTHNGATATASQPFHTDRWANGY